MTRAVRRQCQAPLRRGFFIGYARPSATTCRGDPLADTSCATEVARSVLPGGQRGTLDGDEIAHSAVPCAHSYFPLAGFSSPNAFSSAFSARSCSVIPAPPWPLPGWPLCSAGTTIWIVLMSNFFTPAL